MNVLSFVYIAVKKKPIKFDIVLISSDRAGSNYWICNFLQMTNIPCVCAVFKTLNKQIHMQKSLNYKFKLVTGQINQQYLLCCLKCKYVCWLEITLNRKWKCLTPIIIYVSIDTRSFFIYRTVYIPLPNVVLVWNCFFYYTCEQILYWFFSLTLFRHAPKMNSD